MGNTNNQSQNSEMQPSTSTSELPLTRGVSAQSEASSAGGFQPAFNVNSQDQAIALTELNRFTSTDPLTRESSEPTAAEKLPPKRMTFSDRIFHTAQKHPKYFWSSTTTIIILLLCLLILLLVFAFGLTVFYHLKPSDNGGIKVSGEVTASAVVTPNLQFSEESSSLFSKDLSWSSDEWNVLARKTASLTGRAVVVSASATTVSIASQSDTTVLARTGDVTVSAKDELRLLGNSGNVTISSDQQSLRLAAKQTLSVNSSSTRLNSSLLISAAAPTVSVAAASAFSISAPSATVTTNQLTISTGSASISASQALGVAATGALSLSSSSSAVVLTGAASVRVLAGASNITASGAGIALSAGSGSLIASAASVLVAASGAASFASVASATVSSAASVQLVSGPASLTTAPSGLTLTAGAAGAITASAALVSVAATGSVALTSSSSAVLSGAASASVLSGSANLTASGAGLALSAGPSGALTASAASATITATADPGFANPTVTSFSAPISLSSSQLSFSGNLVSFLSGVDTSAFREGDLLRFTSTVTARALPLPNPSTADYIASTSAAGTLSFNWTNSFGNISDFAPLLGASIPATIAINVPSPITVTEATVTKNAVAMVRSTATALNVGVQDAVQQNLVGTDYENTVVLLPEGTNPRPVVPPILQSVPPHTTLELSCSSTGPACGDLKPGDRTGELEIKSVLWNSNSFANGGVNGQILSQSNATSPILAGSENADKVAIKLAGAYSPALTGAASQLNFSRILTSGTSLSRSTSFLFTINRFPALSEGAGIEFRFGPDECVCVETGNNCDFNTCTLPNLQVFYEVSYSASPAAWLTYVLSNIASTSFFERGPLPYKQLVTCSPPLNLGLIPPEMVNASQICTIIDPFNRGSVPIVRAVGTNTDFVTITRISTGIGSWDDPITSGGNPRSASHTFTFDRTPSSAYVGTQFTFQLSTASGGLANVTVHFLSSGSPPPSAPNDYHVGVTIAGDENPQIMANLTAIAINRHGDVGALGVAWTYQLPVAPFSNYYDTAQLGTDISHFFNSTAYNGSTSTLHVLGRYTGAVNPSSASVPANSGATPFLTASYPGSPARFPDGSLQPSDAVTSTGHSLTGSGLSLLVRSYAKAIADATGDATSSLTNQSAAGVASLPQSAYSALVLPAGVSVTNALITAGLYVQLVCSSGSCGSGGLIFNGAQSIRRRVTGTATIGGLPAVLLDGVFQSPFRVGQTAVSLNNVVFQFLAAAPTTYPGAIASINTAANQLGLTGLPANFKLYYGTTFASQAPFSSSHVITGANAARTAFALDSVPPSAFTSATSLYFQRRANTGLSLVNTRSDGATELLSVAHHDRSWNRGQANRLFFAYLHLCTGSPLLLNQTSIAYAPTALRCAAFDPASGRQALAFSQSCLSTIGASPTADNVNVPSSYSDQFALEGQGQALRFGLSASGFYRVTVSLVGTDALNADGSTWTVTFYRQAVVSQLAVPVHQTVINLSNTRLDSAVASAVAFFDANDRLQVAVERLYPSSGSGSPAALQLTFGTSLTVELVA